MEGENENVEENVLNVCNGVKKENEIMNNENDQKKATKATEEMKY